MGVQGIWIFSGTTQWQRWNFGNDLTGWQARHLHKCKTFENILHITYCFIKKTSFRDFTLIIAHLGYLLVAVQLLCSEQNTISAIDFIFGGGKICVILATYLHLALISALSWLAKIWLLSWQGATRGSGDGIQIPKMWLQALPSFLPHSQSALDCLLTGYLNHTPNTMKHLQLHPHLHMRIKPSSYAHIIFRELLHLGIANVTMVHY